MSDYDLLAIGVNTALDTYYRADRVEVGGVNRVENVLAAPGGKAMNFARAYRRLGGCPLVTGIAGGQTGARIEEGARAEGLPAELVRSRVESRRTFTVDTDSGTTVFLEPGGQFEADDYDSLAARVLALAPNVPTVVIAGSLPPSAKTNYVQTLVAACRAVSAALVAVDTSGEPLRLSANAGVDLIKVNAQEFGASFAVDSGESAMVGHVYNDLCKRGLAILCITDGANGAVIFNDDDVFSVHAPAGRAVSSAGAGDAFLAGLLIGLRDGSSVQDAAKLAAAAGAAATQVVGAGFIDPATVHRLLPRAALSPAEAFFQRARS